MYQFLLNFQIHRNTGFQINHNDILNFIVSFAMFPFLSLTLSAWEFSHFLVAYVGIFQYCLSFQRTNSIVLFLWLFVLIFCFCYADLGSDLYYFLPSPGLGLACSCFIGPIYSLSNVSFIAVNFLLRVSFSFSPRFCYST